MHKSASCRSKSNCTTDSHTDTHTQMCMCEYTYTRTHNIYPCSNTWAHTQTQTNLVKYTNENVAVLGQLGHNRIMDYNTYAYVLVLVADILCRANCSIL